MLPDVINTSINEALSRTVLTSLTTLMVLVVLFFFGGRVIHDFAFTLLIGVIVGTYSSTFVLAALIVEWERISPTSTIRR
jgi:preprotein translocase subunit SecF